MKIASFYTMAVFNILVHFLDVLDEANAVVLTKLFEYFLIGGTIEERKYGILRVFTRLELLD